MKLSRRGYVEVELQMKKMKRKKKKRREGEHGDGGRQDSKDESRHEMTKALCKHGKTHRAKQPAVIL